MFGKAGAVTEGCFALIAATGIDTVQFHHDSLMPD
jgi:hypothetical protein